GAVPMADPFRLVINVHQPGSTQSEMPPLPAVRPPHPPRGPVPEPPFPPAVPPPKRIKIVLDPGHGGSDPGAIGVDQVAEKDVVLKIARKLGNALAATGRFDIV